MLSILLPISLFFTLAWGHQSNNIRITQIKRDAGNPILAWNGDSYIVVWQDNREEIFNVYFTFLARDGGRLIEDRLISDHGDNYSSGGPSLVLEQDRFTVFWFHKGSIYFSAFSYQGEMVQSTSTFYTSTALPFFTITPAKSNYALGLVTRNGKRTLLNFSLFDKNATALSEIIPISSGQTWVSHSHAAYYNDSIAICWADNPSGKYQVYISLFDLSGQELLSPYQVSQSTEKAFSPSIASYGTGFALVWFDERDSNAEIYFITIENGSIKSETRITHADGGSYHPALAWSGDYFGLSWYDYRDGNPDIYFTLLDNEGTRLKEDMRICFDDNHSYNPSIAWAGDRFGIVWIDDRNGNYEVYFTTVKP